MSILGCWYKHDWEKLDKGPYGRFFGKCRACGLTADVDHPGLGHLPMSREQWDEERLEARAHEALIRENMEELRGT